MKEYRKLLNKEDPLGEVKEVKVSYSELRPHPKRNEKEASFQNEKKQGHPEKSRRR